MSFATTSERSSRAADENLKRIYRIETRENESENFITKITQWFWRQRSEALCDVLMKNYHIVLDNIIDAVVQQTKKHKGKIERLSLKLVQLLVQGIKIEVSLDHTAE